MKRISVFALVVVLLFSVLGGCEQGQNENLGENAFGFVVAVAEVNEDITLASEQKINSALTIYEGLSESERGHIAVKEAKYRIDVYKSLYDLLKNAADENAFVAAETARVKAFIESVNMLPIISVIDLTHKELVVAAQAGYAALSEESVLLASVSAAYTRLTVAADKIKKIEQIVEDEILELELDVFFELFNTLSEVSMDEQVRDAIYECSDIFGSLSDRGKELAEKRVPGTKAKLDKLVADYVLLEDTTEANAFVKLMESFSVDKVSLASKKAILDAEFAYESLSEEAKLMQGVSQANDLLKEVRILYNVLNVAEEVHRIERFVTLAKQVPNAEDILISHFFILEKVRAAYDELMAESALHSNVAAAYIRLSDAQKAFDQAGYVRIEAKDPNVQFSGDRPPHIILQIEKNMIDSLCSFYSQYDFDNKQVSLSQLSGKVKMYLNIYESGKICADYVGRIELDLMRDLTHVINGTIVLDAIKTVAESNPNSAIKSGKETGFSINFEDAQNRYIPSAYTKVGLNSNYIWVD